MLVIPALGRQGLENSWLKASQDLVSETQGQGMRLSSRGLTYYAQGPGLHKEATNKTMLPSHCFPCHALQVLSLVRDSTCVRVCMCVSMCVCVCVWWRQSVRSRDLLDTPLPCPVSGKLIFLSPRLWFSSELMRLFTLEVVVKNLNDIKTLVTKQSSSIKKKKRWDA